jgi:hypothetical protein
LKVDRADIDETYSFYQRLKIFDRDGVVANSGVENILKMLKGQGELEGSADVTRFHDASITTPAK